MDVDAAIVNSHGRRCHSFLPLQKPQQEGEVEEAAAPSLKAATTSGPADKDAEALEALEARIVSATGCNGCMQPVLRGSAWRVLSYPPTLRT